MAMRIASQNAERFSNLPWPYVWSSSAGLSLTCTEKKVSVAPTRSSPEWAASDNTPRDPDSSPAASFNSVMAPAASIEFRDTFRFSAEDSARVNAGCWTACGLDVARLIEFLDYKRALGRVQPGDSEGVRLPGAVLITGGLHERQHLRGRREIADRGGQIVVWAVFAADEAPDGRQYAAEVDCVGLADQSSGLAEIQNSQLAAGLEYTVELAQAGLVVGQISESESRDNQIERRGFQRQAERIGFNGNGIGLAGVLRSKFHGSAAEHAARKIRCQDWARTPGAVLEESHGHVAGAAADVEDSGIGVGEDGPEAPRRAPPPEPVHVGGEHMIQQVVPRRNGVEHLAHCSCGRCFVCRA